MSTHQLHSLDVLLQSVRDPESKRLAQDAVAAYQGGAHRAAILSIWVAVCADIISKLKELATGGDAAAQAKIRDLTVWIQAHELKKLQGFENELIEVARKDFEMFLPHEATDLTRLRDDRHLCAHPAFVADDTLFSPTPELARTHITHAILHLLSRSPVQGRQLIARFDRDLSGGSFPTKPEEIETVLRSNYLASAKPGSVVNLIKALAKVLVGAESEKYKGKESQVANSLAAIGRITPAPFEEHMPLFFEQLGRELDDSKIMLLCLYIEHEPRVWGWLGAAGQARILAKVEQAPIIELASAIRARHQQPVAERILARVEQTEPKEVENLIAKYPCRAFVSKALSLYSVSGSYATAERRGEDLILAHAAYLTADNIGQLNTIIRTNPHNQILHATETSTILAKLFQQTTKLLPAAASHWSGIADYVVAAKTAHSYTYPALFALLSTAGVSVPAVPTFPPFPPFPPPPTSV